MQGSACFLTGVVLILIKWALVGICVETYGFWLLFSGFFPTVLGFLRRLPVLGSILDLPVLKTVWGSVITSSTALHKAMDGVFQSCSDYVVVSVFTVKACACMKLNCCC